jgi:hypothetical protein
MNRTQQQQPKNAGTSHTKACVRFGCAAMRPVSIHWTNKLTGAGYPA